VLTCFCLNVMCGRVTPVPQVVRPVLGISFAPDQSTEQLGVKGERDGGGKGVVCPGRRLACQVCLHLHGLFGGATCPGWGLVWSSVAAVTAQCSAS
jgi:hypothetical protein